MKPAIFLIRHFFIFLMLGLMLIFVSLSLVMYFLCADRIWFDFPWFLFADGLIPLLLFLPALIFRNRNFSLAAMIAAFLSILLRISEIVLFQNTLRHIEYNSLKILLFHSDFVALQAVLGKYFLFWLIPLILAVTATVLFCGVLVWKTSTGTSRRFLPFFLLLLGLSLFSNLTFLILQNTVPAALTGLRPLPLSVFHLAKDCISELNQEPVSLKSPIPQKSRKTLEAMHILEPEHQKKPKKTAEFDRIIIIAIESLDYHFLSRNNPKMPRGITPNLDRLSNEYPSMDHYFCAAQPTSWGLNAILLSRMDYEKDKKIRPVSLFEKARERKYHSFYFSAAPGFLDENNTAYKQLFSPDIQLFREDFMQKYGYQIENLWGLSDRTLYTGVLQELKQTNAKRFIAVISTIDTHYPYHHTLPDTWNHDSFNTPFLKALHSSDRELGRFLQAIMKEKELYNDRTLIIVTADHTATHGENYTARNDLIPERVPLIMITPRKKIFRKLNTKKYASSIDLPPTILKLIGAEIPADFMGRDLFSPKNTAITRLMDDRLIIYTPNSRLTIDPDLNPQNHIEQVWRDYYHAFYGE